MEGEIIWAAFTLDDPYCVANVACFEDPFDADVYSTYEAVDQLQKRIESLQERVWGDGTPEGRELDHINEMLEAYEARLRGLEEDLVEGRISEEAAQQEVDALQGSIAKYEEQVRRLETP